MKKTLEQLSALGYNIVAASVNGSSGHVGSYLRVPGKSTRRGVRRIYGYFDHQKNAYVEE
jgi:hypothetical protein